MIEKAAFVLSVNDAWAMLAAFALLGVLVVPFAWRTSHESAVAIKAH
jgi:DHA2 family multidrug resistance protein